jgi:phospholipid/cholesterol/gamma-HCH transport system substrate-binding protein
MNNAEEDAPKGHSADKPATDKPATDKPVTDKPVTDAPVAARPVTDKAATVKPATDKEATDKPADDDEPPVPEMVTGRGSTTRLLRTGIFALVGILILIIGVFVIGDKKNLFSDTFAIYTTFQTVEGLKSGAAVVLNGINVGTVSDVRLLMDTGTYVRVDMVINGDYREFIRSSTVAAIAQQGIIGEKLIELRPGSMEAPIVKADDSIRSAPPTNYLAILDEARNAVKYTENITASLDTLFLRFRRGEGTLGKFLTDDEAYNSLVNVSKSAENLFNESSRNLASMSTTLNKAAVNVDAITLESRNLVSDISHGKGTVGALLYDRSLYDSLESLTGTLTEAASSAGFAAREFGINMRGLRSNWLVGGLFSGGEEKERDVATQQQLLNIQIEEVRRQKELLDQRERELKEKELSQKR